MKNFKLLFPFIFLIACNEVPVNESSKRFDDPVIVPLNTADGYTLNQITQDSIIPIILSTGDTLLSGKPLDAKPTKLEKEALSEPQIIQINTPIQVSNNATKRLVENFVKTNVDEKALVTMNVQAVLDTSNYFIKNSVYDSFPTGVPLSLPDFPSEFIFPITSKVLPSVSKDGAIGTIQNMDIDQGLPASYFLNIIQDKKGNFWLSSDGAGLVKLDGTSVKHYNEEMGFGANTVKRIIETANGDIWAVSMEKGLVKFDGQSVTNYKLEYGFFSNRISGIVEDSKNNIWITTDDCGLIKYDGSKFTIYSKNEGLISNSLTCVAIDDQDVLWIGSSRGFCKFDGETVTRYSTRDGLVNNSLYEIFIDSKKNIWCATDGGVSKFDGTSFTNFTTENGLCYNSVKCVSEDHDGTIWIGTGGGGVSIFDGTSFVTLTEDDGLCSNFIMSVLPDNDGNIWLTSYGGGVSKYAVNSFKHYTEKQGLGHRFILSSMQDSKGNLWFGTLGGGVTMFDGDTVTTYTDANGLANNFVRFIIEDKEGNIWFSCWGSGVSKFDYKTFTNYDTQHGLPSSIIYSMFCDNKGDIWFGSNLKGLTKYNGDYFEHFGEESGLAGKAIHSIIQDKSNNYWIATDGDGLAKYDGKTFIHYSTKEGLISNQVFDVYEDKAGHIWVGSFAGLSRFDGSKFIHFTTKQGLTNNLVWSILEDKKGNIWVGTEKGLSCLTPDLQNKDAYKISTFSKQDGLVGMDFFNQSILLDTENRLWLGSGKGLEMLDLNEFEVDAKATTVNLNQVNLNGSAVDYLNLSDSLKNEIQFDSVARFENYPLNPKFSYQYNHLTFFYSTINWSSLHKVQYQYKLEGLDLNWSPPTTQTFAEYRNLPYGDFVFKVRSRNEISDWSEETAYAFTIVAPWYHRTIARIFFVLIFLALVFLVIKWRTRNLVKKQKQLETIVQERTFEVIKQKEVIEQTHKEITDSITYAERLQRSMMASDSLLKNYLHDYFIYFNPKEAVSGDFYWASKLKNGNFAIVCADSTGHGVPGAIMSMMNMTSLKESIKEGHVEANEILNQTRTTIIETLANDGTIEGGKDGMDAALLIFNSDKTEVEFALANNSLWLVRKVDDSAQANSTNLIAYGFELIEYKADKMPVGRHDYQNIPFSKHTIKLQKGDSIYVFTDGFADQFGGEKGKKYKSSSLKELILSVAHKPLSEQNQNLRIAFEDWKGGLEQVDDVCVIGVRI